MELDPDTCYRAVQSRDRRFDGLFWTGVRSTGIYCRPSCPAITPKRANVTFHRSAAAAQLAGFRACKRCLPDASPGSPEWDVRADAADRAMRLIADGVVDRDGVPGLAEQLGYSVRQLNRIVTEHWGAGPLGLARSRRAQSARVLIEGSDLPMTEIAYAAGFASLRQFNDTVREVYAASPSDLRGRRGAAATRGRLSVRIAVREPFDGAALRDFLAARAVAGIEVVTATGYGRTLGLPGGPGRIELELLDRQPGMVNATVDLTDLRDLAPALERTRRLLDADCDPLAIAGALDEDPVLGGLVRSAPGLRVPGHVDGFEVAVRAVLGQQVTVAGSRTLAGRLVQRYGEYDEPHWLFPTPEALAAADPADLGMPRARGRGLVGLAEAVAAGRVRLDRSAPRAEVRSALLEIPRIGPWTADYVAMRALGDPDIFLPTDVGVRHAAAALGMSPAELIAASDGWRPWRSYALMQLWRIAAQPEPNPEPKEN